MSEARLDCDDQSRFARPSVVAEPTERPFQFRLVTLLIAMSLVATILAVIVPLHRGAREAAQRSECSNHLKQIGLALQNYHDTFNSFPAAWQVDGTGKPAHSWRIAIWPFAESTHYAGQYDYSEPWNGPNNSRLASQMPAWLRCPSGYHHKSEMTSYVAIAGPGTAWPGTSYSSMRDLHDGTANTIMVVEIANSDIHWMEPRDLPVEELKAWLDPNHQTTLLASHRNGVIRGGLAVFADGHTEFLPHDAMEKRLRALLSPAGNEAAEAKNE